MRADGTFIINSVAPGDYTLVIPPRSMPGSGSSSESVQANVSVNGDDIDNVRLVAGKPSKLTGLVIPAASQTNVSLSSLRLVATPANPQAMGGGNSAARVNEDGTFELSVSPGKAFIRMNVAGPFVNTRIKAVRLNGVDVIDSEHDATDAQRVHRRVHGPKPARVGRVGTCPARCPARRESASSRGWPGRA